VSGPDILSVGVLPLITQAEAIVTQIACAEPLAGETRLAVGLRALGDELAALAPRALAATEELQAAHRRASSPVPGTCGSPRLRGDDSSAVWVEVARAALVVSGRV
jgi:hypothetical protein